jgi:hypothetical protein
MAWLYRRPSQAGSLSCCLFDLAFPEHMQIFVRSIHSHAAPLLLLALLPMASLSQSAGSAEKSGATQDNRSVEDSLRSWLPPALTNHSRWSFEFAVGIIGDTTPGDYLSMGFDRYDGPGSGLTYNFTAAYQVHEFDWKIGKRRLQPALEIPFMLTLVDEDSGNVIPDFNLGLVARWRDFPWNRYVYTTFAVGAGLSYSSEVWTADNGRHPGDSGCRLSSRWPCPDTRGTNWSCSSTISREARSLTREASTRGALATGYCCRR